MKKLITAIALIPVIGLSLFPPIEIGMPFTDSKLWLWLVLIFGFLGVCTIFLKINPYIKAISVYGFINLFFTTAPFISQFAYMQLIICVYFYALLLKIEDWGMVFNSLLCVLGVHAILFVMQYFHKDSILNFGLTQNTCTIAVGNAMQAKSVIIILIAILIQKYQGLRKYLYFIYPILMLCGFAYWIDHKCWDNFCYARGGVWVASAKLSWSHPLMGYGMGTFKILFPIMGRGRFVMEGAWLNAHNFIVQNIFEIGLIGTGLVCSYLWTSMRKCKGLLLLGVILVGYTLMFQFPDRMLTAVPLLLLFMAIIERNPYGFESKQS